MNFGPPTRLQERLAALAAILGLAGFLALTDLFVTRTEIAPDLSREPGFFVAAGAATILIAYGAARGLAALFRRAERIDPDVDAP